MQKNRQRPALEHTASAATPIMRGLRRCLRIGRSTECEVGAFIYTLLLAAALGALTLFSAAPHAAPDYRFRPLHLDTPLTLSAQVLTDDERAFIASLPEIRVALPLPPPQPYEVIRDDGEITGIHPEMLGYLAKAFGLRLRPVVLPDWPSVLRAARNRDVDLVMTLGITAERQEYLEFTLGVTPLQGALFGRVPASGVPSPAGLIPPAQLARSLFALERDFLANDFIRRQFPQATVVNVDNTGDALSAVAAGDADYYLGSLLETIAWLSHKPVPGIEMRQLLNYGSGYYHFAVRKDWSRLAAILNKGISTLREAPRPEWSAVMNTLPPGVALPAPLPLSEAESAVLLARPTWRVGAVRGLPMLNDIDARSVHSGIAAEYTEQIARRLAVNVQVMPFDSVAAMFDALRAGTIDLVPFATHTAERAKDFVFSAPYVEMPYVIVARGDAPLYWDLGSLRGRRVALAQQHPLRELIAQRYPDITIVDAANGNAAMDAVERGEADAAVEVKLFANLRINGDAQGALRAVGAVNELPAQFHFATSRSAGALMPLVDRALADIAPTERDRMLRRWVAVDLQPPFPWRRYLPAALVALTALLTLAAFTAWWLRRLSREVQARRRSDARLHDIGVALPGLAFRHEFDSQGRLKDSYFSSGAAVFLGVEIDLQRTLVAHLAPGLTADQRAVADNALRASLGSGERFHFVGAYAHPDGRECWLHVDAVNTPRLGGGRVLTGYVVDESTEHELQRALAREAESRNLLLASASHELRAPTHTLSLALQSIPVEPFDDEARRALRIAKEAARTLAQLLNDVLDAARFAPGPLRLRPQNFSLHELIDTVAEAARAHAASKGLGFDCVMGADVPVSAHLDPLRVKQVLTNLLSNAVKYTVRGRVELKVVLQVRVPARHEALSPPASDVQPMLHFTVSDTGIGIATEHQARLFTPYGTLDDRRVALAPEGSSGLGLVVCRRLATLMGGTLTLSSTPGVGTQVHFLVPMPSRSLRVDNGDAVTEAGASGLVLICDDDDISRLLMAQMLKVRGYEVTEARDGESALARWREGGVHTLVTDVQMDGMDGLQLIRLLRAEEHPRQRRTPVIVCSGSIAAADDDGSLPLYDAFVSKPVDIDVLVETLDSVGVPRKGP